MIIQSFLRFVTDVEREYLVCNQYRLKLGLCEEVARVPPCQLVQPCLYGSRCGAHSHVITEDEYPKLLTQFVKMSLASVAFNVPSIGNP